MDGAAYAECASNTGKRGAALPRGQFVFQARRSAASPADTSGARLTGLSKGSGHGGKSRGGGQPGRTAAWMARLLPNARAAPASVELHCRAVSFVFKRGRSLNLPRTRAAHSKRACRRAAGTAENLVGTGGKTGRPAARTARLLPNARAAPVGVELHCRAVSFVFKCGVRCISRGGEQRTASRLTGEQRVRRKILRGRAGSQSGGMDGASSAECASSTGGRGAALPRGQFVFSSAVCAESPAGTEDAPQAGLPESCGYGGKSRGGGRAGQQHGWRVFCRLRERHRWAENCISARSVLFSCAAFAESPAGTSGARLAGLPESSRHGGKPRGDGRPDNRSPPDYAPSSRTRFSVITNGRRTPQAILPRA